MNSLFFLLLCICLLLGVKTTKEDVHFPLELHSEVDEGMTVHV